MRRRAELIRPAREKNRRHLGGHHLLGPMRAVQRARLWLPIGGEGPEGRWFNPTRLERSDLGVAAMIGLQFEHLPVPVGAV